MLVVSDSSPLNVLIRLECVDVLHRLFGEIIIPSAVTQELTDTRTPQVVRSFLEAPPTWLSVRNPELLVQGLGLGPGETAAISLALEIKADLILIDDRAARNAAFRLGLEVTGVLGILNRAHRERLISIDEVINRLPADFRITKSQLEEVRSSIPPPPPSP